MKKKFGNHYLKFKTRTNDEQRLQREITDYEVILNDKNIAHYFADLSIDTENNFMPESQSFYMKSGQFHISFGQLERSESIALISILADKAFQHSIRWSDETVLIINVSASYVLNLCTDSRHNDTDFKRLLIDFGCSTQSTGEISQLKSLQ